MRLVTSYGVFFSAAGQQDAEEILSKQQAIWKRERDALARAHEETQIENDRLQRLLDTHQSLGEFGNEWCPLMRLRGVCRT